MHLLRILPLAALVALLAACGGSAPISTPVADGPDIAPAPPPDTVLSVAMPEPVPMPAPQADERSLGFDPDTVQAGRFDNGRMFTLDDPPLEYLAETYDFRPDDEWFERAQLGALRFATYCSASFVSAEGLVLTNHHCARQSITAASLEDDVDYNELGYYAGTRAQDKRIEDLFVEQLIEIIDVTEEVDEAAMGETTDQERQQARQGAIQAIEARIGGSRGEDVRAQVIALYAGGQYKAYVFRRYDDVRLVFAPETAVGYFGGDPDNFTYPRYSLDFALFRAYDDDGEPLQPEVYFPFDADGSAPGDLVFVIGNPGSTTRLNTVAELTYRRDVTEAALLDFIDSRANAFRAYLDNNPDDPIFAEREDTFFSLSNARKAYTGRVQGLRDPYIIARRAAAERDYRADLVANAEANAQYGDVVDRIRDNRDRAIQFAPQTRALTAFGPGSPYNGAVLNRGLAYVLSGGEAGPVLGIQDEPEELQINLIAARYRDLLTNFGANDEVVEALLGGRSPVDAARALVEGSALTSRESAEAALDGDLSQDPAVLAAQEMVAMRNAYLAEIRPISAELAELQSQLARSRFEIYGTSTPPDATFSLRISDGVVKSYPYNGSVTPPYTSFYGLYDRHFSQCESGDAECDWALPERWLERREEIPLGTPYNFVSTNDIIGGNSGSPVLDRNLEVVGIAFDGNIQSLPGNYIFDDTLNRTVSVDVRAMLMVLADVYGLDYLVSELTD
ncbi:MAG: S46 family peptidase [Bacteroidota bacterium]